MRKASWWLVLASLVMTMMVVTTPKTVQAAENSKQVLLVYDSQNVADHGQAKIAAVQRILTGLHVRVTTMAAEDYRAGELADYSGLVTLINWPQTKLDNAAFVRDRNRFNGPQLHIGMNLTATEAQRLHAHRTNLYQQQFSLQAAHQGVQQLLPFKTSLTTLTDLPTDARTIGWLTPQSLNDRRYPYGTIVDRNGYLPFLSTGGYAFMLATQTIATLFGTSGHYQPLLTIAKVTPYSNLELLDQLSAWLYAQGIPFAVSTTTVGDNGSFKAYQRFAKVLRRVENRGGVIFLKTPVVGGVTASSGPGLNKLMNSYLIQFAQNQVYPVGISSSAYWNQDRVYRTNSLAKANQVLLLPNPATTTYAHQDNQATIFKQAFYGISATSFESVKQGANLSRSGLDFAIPTALTMTMPNRQASLEDVTRRIHRMNYQWYDPTQQMPQTLIKAGTATIGYHQGTYFLNGAATQVTNEAPKTQTLAPVKPAQSWMNRFFKTQGVVLLVFFSLTLGIFGLFIVIGRRVYLNMFKPK
jgi:uncharacterized protein YdaL